MSEILERRTCLAPGTRLNAQIRRSVSSQVSNCTGTGIGDSYHEHGEPKQQTAKHKAQLAMGKDSNCRCSRKQVGRCPPPCPEAACEAHLLKPGNVPRLHMLILAHSHSVTFMQRTITKQRLQRPTSHTPVSKNEKFLLKITSLNLPTR